jgi:hypothetical protein
VEQSQLGSVEEPAQVTSVEKAEPATESSPSSEPDSPPSKNKENLKTPVKSACTLNLSEILQTSYTPQTRTRTRSVSRTPERSTAAKKILGESPTKSNTDTLMSASKRSMHLVDMVKEEAPNVSTSTPRSPAEASTQRPAKMNDYRLLKSALKNSTIKKAMQDHTSNASSSSTVGKELFPIESTGDSSSVIEVSIASNEEIEISSDNNTVKENSTITIHDTLSAPSSQTETPTPSIRPATSSQTLDDDVNNLMKSINDVLEDEEPQNRASIFTELDETPNNHPLQSSMVATPANMSIFDKLSYSEASSIDKKFDDIVAGNGGNQSDNPIDVQKKGEDVMKWIESAKEVIQTTEPKTTQILCARYSDITPNNSVVANSSTSYDTKTPKMSILGTVGSVRKSDIEGLTKNPISRLSISNNSTEVVENYQVSSDIPKSLRSTRKRIGSAIASVLNTTTDSTTADTTINESLNASAAQQDENLSQFDKTNILSLDDMPPPESVSEGACPELSTSMNFIQFANHEADNDDKEVFEISLEENNAENIESDEESESDSSADEQEEGEQEDDINNGLDKDKSETENNMCRKFRLSKQDLEEEGVLPLDVSKSEEDIEMNAADITPEHVEIPATQAFDDESELTDDQDSSSVERKVVIDQTEERAANSSVSAMPPPTTDFSFNTSNSSWRDISNASSHSSIDSDSPPPVPGEDFDSRPQEVSTENRVEEPSNEEARTELNICEEGDTDVESLPSDFVLSASSSRSLQSVPSDIGNTINELITAPTNVLAAVAMERSLSELASVKSNSNDNEIQENIEASFAEESEQNASHAEIPATQAFDEEEEDQLENEAVPAAEASIEEEGDVLGEIPGPQTFDEKDQLDSEVVPAAEALNEKEDEIINEVQATKESDEQPSPVAELFTENDDNVSNEIPVTQIDESPQDDVDEVAPNIQIYVNDVAKDSEIDREEIPDTSEFKGENLTNNDSAFASQTNDTKDEQQLNASSVKEEHLRSSFLATYETEVNESAPKEDEIPINKSIIEYSQIEYLESSSLLDDSKEEAKKQNASESALFSETEMSRVEVSSLINRLKSDGKRLSFFIKIFIS